MNDYFIASYKIKKKYNIEKSENLFEYNENKKLKFIQKICFYILKKLNCNYINRNEFVDYEQIFVNDVIDIIYEYKDQLQLIFDKKAKYLILGKKQIEKLKVSQMEYLDFKIPDTYKNEKIYLAGLKVILIPWIDGVIVLPNIIE